MTSRNDSEDAHEDGGGYITQGKCPALFVEHDRCIQDKSRECCEGSAEANGESILVTFGPSIPRTQDVTHCCATDRVDDHESPRRCR